MHDLIKSYFAIGQDLQCRLSNPQISDPKLPEDIAKWIFKTTEELLQIMPQECQDYIDLDNIKDKYKDNQSIILPSVKLDIHKV